MQIYKQLPTYFRVIVTSHFGSGSPGTLAAEQMPKCYSVGGDAVSVEHITAGINQKNTHFTAILYLPKTHQHPDHHTQPSTCCTHPSKYTRLCPVHITTTPLVHQPQCPFTNPIIHTHISPFGTLYVLVDPQMRALECFTTSATNC
jgi:hypothetical protein